MKIVGAFWGRARSTRALERIMDLFWEFDESSEEDGKNATPVPRVGCVPFSGAPILAGDRIFPGVCASAPPGRAQRAGIKF